jgi:cell division transport system ATP-binding protein
VITGKSGVGKTTIGRLLIRDLVPNKGRIVVEGIDLNKIKPQSIPVLRRKIGFAFQDFRLIADKTVGENITVALEIAGYDSKKIPEKVKHTLKMVGLSGKENLFPGQLSGGEVQRASIARAIAADPPILFADEPTGNLDKETSLEIFDLLRKINSDGTTVIVATHDISLINQNDGNHIHLEEGKITKIEKHSGEKKEEKK